MATLLARKSWSPYVVAALIGSLSWFPFMSADKPLGTNTAFENTAPLVSTAVGVAASGEGHLDAMFGVGVAGMLVGAAVYVAGYPELTPLINALGDWGGITFPDLTSTSPWLWMSGLVAAIGLGLLLISFRTDSNAGNGRAGFGHG